MIFNQTNDKKMKKKILPLLALTALISLNCRRESSISTKEDFKTYYDQFNVSGSFILYDPQKEQQIYYNQSQLNQPFIPASTFKICNSLIGLETGVVTDENTVIKWDSITRPVQNWNSDQDLKSAFKNSTVWYYQEVAKRVGGERMKLWLTKASYGNMDTTGGIDKFWLTGALRITPSQQIDFLKRLRNNELPFSKHSIDIIKKIMVVKDSANYTLRAKTGWSEQEGMQIGWYVGYIEKSDNVYYFANCVQLKGDATDDFIRSRREITLMILKELGIQQ